MINLFDFESQMVRIILSFAGFTEFTTSVPKIYWDVKSQEQRIHGICKLLNKCIEGIKQIIGHNVAATNSTMNIIIGNLPRNTGLFIWERPKMYTTLHNMVVIDLDLLFENGQQDEAHANTAATNVMLLDCLQARRDFCKIANERFGLNLQVYFNDDFESYNFNYLSNVESLAQDGLIRGESDEQMEMRHAELYRI